MTPAVVNQLLAIGLAVVLGWVAGRRGWLGGGSGRSGDGGDPARLLGDLTFTLLVPALLFRTSARIDFATLPWRTLAAYFIPALAVLLTVYMSGRRRGPPGADAAVRSVAATYGNAVQIGIPFAAALFGETGLAIHVAVVSLHALVLLTTATALAELDIARASDTTSLRQAVVSTVRNTIVHPVVMPVLAGLVFNAVGLTLPAPVDQLLLLLSAGVVPLCLLLIGLSLAQYGMSGSLRAALAVAAVKLLLLPALVLLVAHGGFGLRGTPLAVLVLAAALPAGSNALIFAQRYRTLTAEASSVIVLSTLAFAATGPGWLWVVHAMP